MRSNCAIWNLENARDFVNASYGLSGPPDTIIDRYLFTFGIQFVRIFVGAVDGATIQLERTVRGIAFLGQTKPGRAIGHNQATRLKDAGRYRVSIPYSDRMSIAEDVIQLAGNRRIRQI